MRETLTGPSVFPVPGSSIPFVSGLETTWASQPPHPPAGCRDLCWRSGRVHQAQCGTVPKLARRKLQLTRLEELAWVIPRLSKRQQKWQAVTSSQKQTSAFVLKAWAFSFEHLVCAPDFPSLRVCRVCMDSHLTCRRAPTWAGPAGDTAKKTRCRFEGFSSLRLWSEVLAIETSEFVSVASQPCSRCVIVAATWP